MLEMRMTDAKQKKCSDGANEAETFITGNSFPVNLFRRKAEVIPETFENYLAKLHRGQWESYWGHSNTLEAVNRLCGVDLTPREVRPALSVDTEGYPVLYGKSYRECWVLTPEYRPEFRPAIGVEVTNSDILSWQVVRILWAE